MLIDYCFSHVEGDGEGAGGFAVYVVGRKVSM